MDAYEALPHSDYYSSELIARCNDLFVLAGETPAPDSHAAKLKEAIDEKKDEFWHRKPNDAADLTAILHEWNMESDDEQTLFIEFPDHGKPRHAEIDRHEANYSIEFMDNPEDAELNEMYTVEALDEITPFLFDA